MKRSIQMVVVLGVISLLSGLALGGLHQLTYERAQNNILKFKKIPAVADIYEVVAGTLPPAEREAIEEGLLAEKRLVKLDGIEDEVLFFVIRKDGEPYAVTIEDLDLDEAWLLVRFLRTASYAGVTGLIVIPVEDDSLWDSDSVAVSGAGIWDSDSVAVTDPMYWGTVATTL